MHKRWEDDWMHAGPMFVPTHVVLSRLFENDELKALIRFHGTSQRHFYTVARFESGVWSELEEHFPSLEEAKAAAEEKSGPGWNIPGH